MSRKQRNLSFWFVSTIFQKFLKHFKYFENGLNDQISDFFASEAHNSLLSFWAKLGYSQIEIDHIAVSLLKLQIEIGVHLISVKLSQLLTLVEYVFSQDSQVNFFTEAWVLECTTKSYLIEKLVEQISQT